MPAYACIAVVCRSHNNSPSTGMQQHQHSNYPTPPHLIHGLLGISACCICLFLRLLQLHTRPLQLPAYCMVLAV